MIKDESVPGWHAQPLIVTGLRRTLRGLGFIPFTPPSNLVSVGHSTTLIPKRASSRPSVMLRRLTSRVPSSYRRAQRSSPTNYILGRTGVRVDLEWLMKGDVNKNYQINVHYSLTDVVVHEISIGNNRRVFSKMMAKRECNEAVMDLIDAGGYVCQVRRCCRRPPSLRPIWTSAVRSRLN